MPQNDRSAPVLKQQAGGMTPFDLVLYFGTVVIWGLGWTGMHYQVGPVAPEVSLVWRYLPAAPLMFALAAWRGERLSYALVDHATFAALGLTIFSLNYVLVYYASHHVASGLLSILFTTAAIGNVVLGALFFGFKVNRRVFFGGLLGVAGVAAMFYPEVKDIRFDSGALLGFVLGLIGTMSFCTGNMISIAAQRRRLPVFASLAWAMAYGMLFLTLLALISGRAFIFDWRPSYVISLAYLSVFASFIGFAAYFTLLGRIGAARTGYSTVLYPVIALTASTLVEGYRWTPLSVAGLAGVIVGVALVLRQREA